jgi:hypothetical protein
MVRLHTLLSSCTSLKRANSFSPPQNFEPRCFRSAATSNWSDRTSLLQLCGALVSSSTSLLFPYIPALPVLILLLFRRFSKFSNQGDSQNRPAPTLVPVDLNTLAVDLIKSCWSQVRQYVSTTNDGEGDAAHQTLEVFFESSVAPGTIGLVDVGGLKRVLINLFGNALKVRSSFLFVNPYSR